MITNKSDTTFKEYYYLNKDMTVRFYYLKEYTDETIFGEH